MKKGFTLIELLIVVLIIGILSAVALPQYQTAVDKARYSIMMTSLRALKNAQNLYYLANGNYATDITELEDTLPAECKATSQTTATCPNFTLTVEAARTYARLRRSPKNAFMMYYQPADVQYNMLCYAYAADGERGRRLCKSIGGIQMSESENSDCNGDCTHYRL